MLRIFARDLLGAVSHRLFVPVCLALAFGLRIAWILAADAQPISDFNWYYSRGRELAAGQGYVLTDTGFPLWERGEPLPAPRPTAFWPIGYPVFLGALFRLTEGLTDPLLTAKVANAFLYVGLIVATSYSATVVCRSRLAGNLCALLLALLPNHIAYTSITSVEIYFAFLIACGTALVLVGHSHRSWLAGAGAGLCFGLATLTKGQALLLPLVILLVLHRRDLRRLLAQASLVYVGVAVCLLPWTWRNYQAFERFVPVSNNGGINLLIGNMPGGWGQDGLMWNRELHTIVTSTSDEVERDVRARAAAWRYISENPGQMLLTLPRKLVLLYLADVDGFGWNYAAMRKPFDDRVWLVLRGVSQIFYLVLWALAVAFVWPRRGSDNPAYGVGLGAAAYFTAIYLVFFGGPRFHFPVMPWLAVYAAGGLASLLEAAKTVTDQKYASHPPGVGETENIVATTGAASASHEFTPDRSDW